VNLCGGSDPGRLGHIRRATPRRFVTAVLNIAPGAGGPAVLLYEAGRTVVRALLVAGAVTLELCALFGLQLNFANIIALPLLLAWAWHSRSITSWRGDPAKRTCSSRA
jgi:hypothetical protein